MATTSWLIVTFGDDIWTERLGFKALTGAIPRKQLWPVTVWITRTLATASPKVRMSQDVLTRAGRHGWSWRLCPMRDITAPRSWLKTVQTVGRRPPGTP